MFREWDGAVHDEGGCTNEGDGGMNQSQTSECVIRLSGRSDEAGCRCVSPAFSQFQRSTQTENLRPLRVPHSKFALSVRRHAILPFRVVSRRDDAVFARLRSECSRWLQCYTVVE